MTPITGDACVCAPDQAGVDLSCGWVRGKVGDDVVGHVARCPTTGSPCQCLPGSTAHAYCTFDAEAAPIGNKDQPEEAS